MNRARPHQTTRGNRKREESASSPAPAPHRPRLHLIEGGRKSSQATGLRPVVAREIIAAQSTLGNQHVQRLIARADDLKTWTSSSTLGEPVAYDKRTDAYVAKWELGEPAHEGAAVELDEEAAEMARVQDLALESNADNTSMKTTYARLELQQRFLDIINTMHAQVRETEAALKERKAELKKAQSALAAAKARAKSASEEEKADADFEVSNAEEMVKMQEGLIPEIEERITDLKARIRAGIANLRLHEKTHLAISAQVATMANRELNAVKKLKLADEDKADLRQRIVDSAFRIEGEVQGRMDGLLNPSVVGTQAETSALVAWTTDREKKPAERHDEEDYHSMLREKFAEARDNDWQAPAEK